MQKVLYLHKVLSGQRIVPVLTEGIGHDGAAFAAYCKASGHPGTENRRK